MTSRADYNKGILETLQGLVEKYPDLRFGQLLIVCNIVKCVPVGENLYIKDCFYEESKDTYNRLLKSKICNYDKEKMDSRTQE